MTTNEESTESRMLEQVRRWRREAYEADRSMQKSDRRAKLNALAKRYGLDITPSQPRDPSDPTGTDPATPASDRRNK
jgi:hypothetical protein